METHCVLFASRNPKRREREQQKLVKIDQRVISTMNLLLYFVDDVLIRLIRFQLVDKNGSKRVSTEIVGSHNWKRSVMGSRSQCFLKQCSAFFVKISDRSVRSRIR